VPWARNVGKGVILGCIFGSGAERLKEELLKRIPDLDPDSDFKGWVQRFRARHPLIFAVHNLFLFLAVLLEHENLAVLAGGDMGEWIGNAAARRQLCIMGETTGGRAHGNPETRAGDRLLQRQSNVPLP
jgi:hypothetical protein